MEETIQEYAPTGEDTVSSVDNTASASNGAAVNETSPSSAGGATSFYAETTPAKWTEALKDEGLRANRSLAKFNDVDGLAKSYVELSRKLGSKGLMPLPEGATAEQIAAHRALKRGENIREPANYSFHASEAERSFAPDVDNFSNLLFDAGCDDETHSAVMSAVLRTAKANYDKVEAEGKVAIAQAEEEMRNEWGEQYAVNRKAVDLFMGKFPEVKAIFEESGLIHVPEIQRMIFSLNRLTADGEIRFQQAVEKSYDDRLKDIENSADFKNEWSEGHKAAKRAWVDLLMKRTSQRR